MLSPFNMILPGRQRKKEEETQVEVDQNRRMIDGKRYKVSVHFWTKDRVPSMLGTEDTCRISNMCGFSPLAQLLRCDVSALQMFCAAP